MQVLENQNITVIPDIHQRIDWVRSIMEQEDSWTDTFVFLGDYFDTFDLPGTNGYYSFKDTCDWCCKTAKNYDQRIVWLTGNHDISYISSWNPNINFLRVGHYICSGFSRNKATTFNRRITSEWIDRLDLCCFANGYALSHAGFHSSHFGPYETPEQGMHRLQKEWEKDRYSFKVDSKHWIGHVGVCRGGYNKIGSPVWLDWNQEFEPIENFPQIVGHTEFNPHVYNQGKFTERHYLYNSGNYNIDAHRTSYMKISATGEISFDVCNT